MIIPYGSKHRKENRRLKLVTLTSVQVGRRFRYLFAAVFGTLGQNVTAPSLSWNKVGYDAPLTTTTVRHDRGSTIQQLSSTPVLYLGRQFSNFPKAWKIKKKLHVTVKTKSSFRNFTMWPHATRFCCGISSQFATNAWVE